VIRNNKGFSLLEVLIAVTVMASCVVVVAMAWSGSQLRIRKMRLNNQAAFLLDYKVAETEKKFRNEITLLPELDKGDFEDLSKEYKGFTWEMKSKKFEMPDISSFLKQNKNGADPLMMMVMEQMKTYFSQAAKEVTVTVVYTFGKTKVQYSATTFLVDFNQQIPMPDLSSLGGGANGGGATGGGGPGGGTN
jgi:prepilin-type N-terminal cleavage/methylation domain-containing protein